jgi:outer membrane protein TolC
VVLGLPTSTAGQSLPAGRTVPLRLAIQEAMANSRTLADAEYDLEVASQQVREAWASVMPDISGSASYQRNLLVQELFFDPSAIPGGGGGDPVRVRIGSDNTWQLGFTVSQPLFEYGVFIGVGAASRFRALQEERLRGTTQQVVTAVRGAYFDALLAESNLRLLEQSVERVAQTLEETRALYRAGLTSQYDVLRVEVEYANIAANLQRARNAVRARKRVLLVEMGYDPESDVALEGRLDEVDPESLEANTPENVDLIVLAGLPGVLDSGVTELLQVAAAERTDLRQLRANILLEEARVKVEKGEFVPRLSLFGNYSLQAQEDGTPDFFGNANQRTSSSAAGVRVEMPIFQGFRRFARVQQAEATVRQIETRLVRAEQEAVNQVRTLYEAVDEALARARSQFRAVEQAERGYEIASAEYREGIGSQLQVTDAEVALRQAQFNYAQAIYDFLTARAQLELAVGLVPERPGAFPVAGTR